MDIPASVAQPHDVLTDLRRRRSGLGALSSPRAETRERARRGREMLAAEIETLSGAARKGAGAGPGSRPTAARGPAALSFPARSRHPVHDRPGQCV